MGKVLRFDDFLFESKNKYEPFELVLEGGAYGHVTYPIEDILEYKEFDSLSIEEQEIKDIAISNGTFMKAPNDKKTNLSEKQWLQVRTKKFINWFGDWLNNPENSSKVIDENGEPMVVYHGSRNGKFDCFDPTKGNPCLSGGVYFTNSKDFASKFGNHIYDVYLKLQNPNYDGFDGSGADMSPSIYRDGGIFTKRQTDKYAIKGTKEYIVFEPTQIKSATDNNGEFNSNNKNITK